MSSLLSDNSLQPVEDMAPEGKPEVKSLIRSRWRRMYEASTNSIRRKLSDLTISQWMYLIAFILLISSIDQELEDESTLVWVGVIAGIGLARELWHVFNRIWNNILGKGFIFVLYAATANFALAVSALKINAISGVEPAPFVFTIGFATLLMLPFWLLIATIVFFSIALIAGNLWLIVSILLRLVRIKIQVHWEDRSFVFVTMLLRLILIPSVIMTTFYMTVPFAEQIELFKRPIAVLKAAANEQDEEASLEGEPIVIEDDPDTGTKVIVDPSIAKMLSDDPSKIGVLDKMIARFIFHFETYSNSVCKKKPEQKSLIINENFILLVERDESELGFKFSAGPCIGRFEEPLTEQHSDPVQLPEELSENIPEQVQ